MIKYSMNFHMIAAGIPARLHVGLGKLVPTWFTDDTGLPAPDAVGNPGDTGYLWLTVVDRSPMFKPVKMNQPEWPAPGQAGCWFILLSITFQGGAAYE